MTGVGSDDNASFTIDGTSLETGAAFDFETKSSYSIRVRTTDNTTRFFEEQFTISVTNVDEAPTDISLSSGSVAENQVSGTTVGTLSTTPPDADTHTYTLVSGVGSTDNASFTIIGTTLNTNAVFDRETKDSYSIRVRSTDAAASWVEKQFAITVTNVNEAPTDISLTNSSVAENQASGTTVDTLVSTDVDVGDTHTYTLVSGTGATDNASFTISGTSLKTAAAFDFESKASYSIRIRTTDAGSLTFEEVFTISVTNVNEAPVNTVPSAQTADEDTDLTFSSGSGNALSVSDVDAGSSAVKLSLDAAHGTLTLASTAGLTFVDGTANGTASVHFTGTIANINIALAGLKYKGALNWNSTLGTETLTIVTNDQGNSGSGGALSDTDSFGITVNAVNDAPVADDESFTGASGAIGNTGLVVNGPTDGAPALSSPKKTISGDILAGDSDVDGPGPLTITAGTFATNDGGSVTVESDGDFTFHPAASTSCTDTSDFFDYTVEDSGSPEQTDTGRATIAIAGCVWYVSNNAAGNSGTSAAPFDTLAQAENASGANHTVFVLDGDNTVTGYGGDGYALNAGERLIGEHEGLQVDPDQGGALATQNLHPANAGAHPTLTATNADVVALDDGNEIRGFNIDPQGTGGGIAGALGDTGGGTIDDVNIVDTGTAGAEPGLELDATTGTFNVTNLVVNNSAATSPPGTATGVRLNNAGTTDFGSTTITTSGAAGLSAVGTNMSTSTFDAITVAGSTAGGVSLTTLTGTTALGDGLGTDLNLTTTSGAAAGLFASSAGSLTVGAAGTDEIHATGGPAVDVSGTTGAVLDFEDVDSTNSANDGINLDGLGTGTFTAGSGSTITGAAGIAFDLNAGSGNVDFLGTITNGEGSTAEVTGRTGGAVTLSGPITESGDLDMAQENGGISVTGNTGGSTVFSHATTKDLTTGEDHAVVMGSSDGHTLTFSNGNLDIDTASGKGLEATTSGTLTVEGSANTIDTTTGRAVNVSDTDIGNNDLTFQRISSNGAVNGIRLNNTANALGRLFVAGIGGTCTSAASCTGGAIQSSTGAGVELTSVPGGVSLTRSAVTGGQDDGIRATTVGTTGGTGLDLANSWVSSNGNAVGERGLDYDNVIGSSSITNSTIRVSSEDNARWENDSGTLGLTVTGSTFADNSAVSGADGLLLLGDAAATMTANITNSTFTHNRDDGFQLAMKSPVSGSHAPQLNVTFTGNDVVQGVNNAPNNAAMHISNGSAGDVKFKMDDNDLSGSLGSALILNPGPDGTSAASFDAIVTNNRIGTGVADSGSVSGIGLWGRTAGNGVNRFEIRNNTIRNFQQQGMYLRGNEGTGQVTDYTVTGNTVTNPDGTGFRILLEAGSTAGDSTDVCFDFGGATAALKNTVASGGSPADIGVARDFAANTLTLRDYAGGNLSSYFNSRNVGTPSSLTAILSNLAPAGSASACALPATPPLP